MDGTVDEATVRLIGQFEAYLAHEANASPHTIKGYGSDLRQFAAFLAERGERLADVDVHGVRAYLASLAGTARKTSVARKLAALKHFFRHGASHGGRTDDPAASLSAPKRERFLPPHLTVDEMFRVLDGVRAAGPIPATAPSSSCCTRPASGSASSSASTGSTSIAAAPWCGCSARAGRSASCRSAPPRSRRSRAIGASGLPTAGVTSAPCS
jgi:hypothetical protein